jgi:hypothetical protein
VVLANGAVIVGFDNCCSGTYGLQSNESSKNILIDWNGPDGNNTLGDDQLELVYCFGSIDCTSWAIGPKGHFLMSNWLASNTALYQSIFSQ